MLSYQHRKVPLSWKYGVGHLKMIHLDIEFVYELLRLQWILPGQHQQRLSPWTSLLPNRCEVGFRTEPNIGHVSYLNAISRVKFPCSVAH